MTYLIIGIDEHTRSGFNKGLGGSLECSGLNRQQ